MADASEVWQETYYGKTALFKFETAATLIIKEKLQLFKAARLNSEGGEAAAPTT